MDPTANRVDVPRPEGSNPSPSAVRDAELAALIAEQERDMLYGDATNYSREVSLDAPLSDDADAGTLTDLVGEADTDIDALLGVGEDETAVRIVRDSRVRREVTDRDVASWRWARSRRKWSYRQIAEHFGFGEETVRTHLLTPARRAAERLTRLEARLEFAKAAYEAGAELMDIAAELYEEAGYATPESCRQQLLGLFERHGIERRPGGWKHGMRSVSATPEQRAAYAREQHKRHRAKPLSRCSQSTKGGRRCKRWAIEGSELCMVHGLPHPTQKWTQENVADALRAWTWRHGREPRRRDWQKASDDHPSFPTVYRLFGSWPAALDAALNEAVEAA